MLGKTRKGVWLGAGAAIIAVGLTGCGNSKKTGSRESAAAAGVTSASTGGATSGSTSGGGSGGGTIGGGGGTIGGGGGTGGGGTVGGGGTGGGGTGTGGGTSSGSTPPAGVSDDHANNATGASTLSTGTPRNGAIEYAGDHDWFKIDLTQGVDYTFFTNNLGANMDTVLRLIGPTGTQLAENDDEATGTPTSRIIHSATTSGTHYVVVLHKSAQASTGSYAVGAILGASNPGGVTPDDHKNDATTTSVLTLGTAMNGEIETAGDIDWFKVTLAASTDYTFRTDLPNGTGDTIIALYDGAGNFIDENDDDPLGGGLHSRLEWTSQAAGDYFVEVRGYGSNNPIYTVIAELGGGGSGGGGTANPNDDHLNDMTTTSALTVGTAMSGEIEVAGDVDWFKVDLTGGTAYEFKTENLGTGMDTYLSLLDDQGNLVDYNDDARGGSFTVASRVPNDETQTFTPTADGTYYLEVRHYGATTGTGTYDVVAMLATAAPPPPADDHGDDAATATAFAVGGMVAGTVEVGGDNDWFKVDLVAGATYEFKTQNMGNSMDTRLYLIDTDGTTQLAYNDDVASGDRSSRIAGTGTLFSGSTGSGFTAPADGTYYLRVNDFQTTRVGGTYEVTAIQLSGSTTPPPATVASLTGALWDDVDGSYGASAGDTLTLTFSEAVSIVQIAIFPPPPLLADDHFALPVAGDSFGQNAAWDIAATNSSQVVITLGQGATMRLSGTFDAAKLTAGAPSGVEVKATSTLSTASSGQTVQTGQQLDVATNVNPGFVPSADMVEARGGFAATVMNDGRVLVTGGRKTASSFAYKNELYDPATDTWSEVMTSGMGFQQNSQAYAIGRFDHAQTLLADGRVLITGGRGFESLDPQATTPTPVIEELTLCFVFDPATDMFSFAGQLNIGREGHYATLLPNGQVLITGGYNSAVNAGQGGTLPVAELWDPTTNTFTMVSTTGQDMVYAREAGAAHVVNGNVLHVGGMLYAATTANPTVTGYMAPGTEVFDVATGTSAAGPTMTANRRWFATVEPAAGQVMVIAGDTGGAAVATVEQLDPTTNTFSSVGNLTAARARHGAAIMGNTVVVAGGISIDYAAGTVTYVANGEVYDLTANVTETYQLQHGRNSHRVVALKNGKVMVIGGWESGLTTVTGSDGTAVQACEVFVRP